MKNIELNVLRELNKDQTQIHCGCIKDFTKYLESQNIFQASIEKPKEINALYGIPVVQSKIMPKNQVAMFVGNKLVSVFEIPSGMTS